MKVFPSKSSALVKLITFSFVAIVILVSISLVMAIEDKGIYYGAGITVVLFAVAFYFYTQSVVNVTLSDDALVINKKFGRIALPFQTITAVEKLGFHSLVLNGSKGVFGFIGIPMDDSYSYVKDRNKMIKIYTDQKNYLLSCESRDELMAALDPKIAVQP